MSLCVSLSIFSSLSKFPNSRILYPPDPGCPGLSPCGIVGTRDVRKVASEAWEGLLSNHCILSSRFLLPSNSCLPRDKGPRVEWVGGGTSWFPVGVGMVPGIRPYLRSISCLPPILVAVNIP